MTMYAGITAVSSAVTVIGIVTFAPLVVVVGTLCACGTLLFALLHYFDQTEA